MIINCHDAMRPLSAPCPYKYPENCACEAYLASLEREEKGKRDFRIFVIAFACLLLGVALFLVGCSSDYERTNPNPAICRDMRIDCR